MELGDGVDGVRLGLTRGSGISARSISMHYDQSFILTFTAKLACRFVKRVVYPIYVR